jgi:hypothetical protein
LLLTGRGSILSRPWITLPSCERGDGDSAADDPLRFGRSTFWASGLTDFNRALRIACVRCCNRQVLWPRRYLPKLADRLCRHANVLVYLNSHRVWKATDGNLERGSASWFVPHLGFSRFGSSAKTEARSISSEGSQSQPAPGAPRSLRGAYRDRLPPPGGEPGSERPNRHLQSGLSRRRKQYPPKVSQGRGQVMWSGRGKAR